MSNKRSLISDRYQRTVYCALHAMTVRLQSTIVNEFSTINNTPTNFGEAYGHSTTGGGAIGNNRLLKLLAKLTRRMHKLERNSKTIKFSKAFDLLLDWASQQYTLGEMVNKQDDDEDTDSETIQIEFADLLPKPDNKSNRNNSLDQTQYCLQGSHDDQIPARPYGDAQKIDRHQATQIELVRETQFENTNNSKQILSATSALQVLPQLSQIIQHQDPKYTPSATTPSHATPGYTNYSEKRIVQNKNNVITINPLSPKSSNRKNSRKATTIHYNETQLRNEVKTPSRTQQATPAQFIQEPEIVMSPVRMRAKRQNLNSNQIMTPSTNINYGEGFRNQNASGQKHPQQVMLSQIAFNQTDINQRTDWFDARAQQPPAAPVDVQLGHTVEVIKQTTGLPKRSGTLVKKHYKPKPASELPAVTDVMRSTKMPDIQKVENNSSFFGKRQAV